MAVEVETSHIQICDANGDPVSGAKVYIYDVGTTTLKTVYSDTGLSVSVANPIVCDSAGRHAIRYIATGSYKYHVKTSADVSVFDAVDNVDGRVPVGSGALAIANGGTGSTTAGAALTALGGATAAELADVAADVAALSGTLASTEKTHIATGTTAQRVSSPVAGDIRFNTDNTLPEVYNGTNWDAFAVTASDTDPSASDTQEGLIELAIQSEMETATDVVRAVVPGRQHFHPAHPKCWAYVTVSGGTPTLQTSHNITSVTDSGVGDLLVTIATDFSTANWSPQATVEIAAANGVVGTVDAQAAGTVTLFALDTSLAKADPASYSMHGLGDQA